MMTGRDREGRKEHMKMLCTSGEPWAQRGKKLLDVAECWSERERGCRVFVQMIYTSVLYSDES